MTARPPDNRELLAQARAWAEANYPGCPLESISLRLRFLPAAVRLVYSPAAARPVSGAIEEDEEGGPGLHPCSKDILATLRGAGRRLSKTRLMEALEERHRRGEGGEWSERTVCRRLAEMQEDGTLDNPPEARPRGYGIVE